MFTDNNNLRNALGKLDESLYLKENIESILNEARNSRTAYDTMDIVMQKSKLLIEKFLENEKYHDGIYAYLNNRIYIYRIDAYTAVAEDTGLIEGIVDLHYKKYSMSLTYHTITCKITD